MSGAQSIWLASASHWSGPVDALFYSLLALSGVVGVVLAGLVIVYSVRYRRQGRGIYRPRLEHANIRRVEIAWTLVPLALFLTVFTLGASTWLDMKAPPAGTLDVYGLGKQWMWKFQHPTGRGEINELHLPAGEPVRVVLGSEDVIHSFYVPAFRVKQDAVPGLYTEVWFVPTRTGRFRLMCTEYCGAEHARMHGFVHVMEPAEYAQWSVGGEADENAVRAGAQLFRAIGCNACHAEESSVRAPPLAGLYGRRVATESGFATADEAYLRDSILLPDALVTAGYEPVMPSYAGQITEADVLALVAYLKSLDAGVTP